MGIRDIRDDSDREGSTVENNHRGFWLGLAAFAVAILSGGRVSAETIELTSVGSSGTINGALFQQASPQPTGTGVIDSFVRIQNRGVEQGYNTSARPVQFDEKTDPNFTRPLLLSSVPVVNINGTNYRQFLLDINEKKTDPGKFLSLDQLQIFQANRGDLNNFPNLGTKIYDLDAGGDHSILLDYSLNHGSGSGDMFAYIPDSLFDPSLSNVYLFSQFGSDPNARADAGFEEWAVLEGGGGTPPVNEVPAPATLVFAAVGCGLGLLGRAVRGSRNKPATCQA